MSTKDPSRRTFEGIVFASVLECNVYKILRTLLPADQIILQPKFHRFDKCEVPSGLGLVKMRVSTYKADFAIPRKGFHIDAKLRDRLQSLLTPANSKDIRFTEDIFVIDAKGFGSETDSIKRRVFAALYGWLYDYVQSGRNIKDYLKKIGYDDPSISRRGRAARSSDGSAHAPRKG